MLLSREIIPIPLEKIKIQKFNVRKKDIQLGIEDLAASIKTFGLLQPITVYFDSENERYVILAGQRRFNAYNYLNEHHPGDKFDKIDSIVIEEPKTDDLKKALSLTENITQLQMQNMEVVKAVTDLYNTYRDYEMVEEEYGITPYMVDKYVSLARLPPRLIDAINEGEIHSNQKTSENAAIRAVQGLNWTKGGEVDEESVLELAKTYAEGEIEEDILTSEARKGGTPAEIKERAAKKPKTKIDIDLSLDVAEKLNKVSESTGQKPKARATSYIVQGVTKDYKELTD